MRPARSFVDQEDQERWAERVRSDSAAPPPVGHSLLIARRRRERQSGPRAPCHDFRRESVLSPQIARWLRCTFWCSSCPQREPSASTHTSGGEDVCGVRVSLSSLVLRTCSSIASRLMSWRCSPSSMDAVDGRRRMTRTEAPAEHCGCHARLLQGTRHAGAGRVPVNLPATAARTATDMLGFWTSSGPQRGVPSPTVA